MRSLGQAFLCATDLSPEGDRALRLALALAGERGVVHLVHVCVPELLVGMPGMAPVGVVPHASSDRTRAEREARAHLGRLITGAAAATGSHLEPHVLHAAEPAPAILGLASRLNVDAIVLATSARGGLAKLLLGSVSVRITRAADKPVILLRAQRFFGPQVLAEALP